MIEVLILHRLAQVGKIFRIISETCSGHSCSRKLKSGLKRFRKQYYCFLDGGIRLAGGIRLVCLTQQKEKPSVETDMKCMYLCRNTMVEEELLAFS